MLAVRELEMFCAVAVWETASIAHRQSWRNATGIFVTIERVAYKRSRLVRLLDADNTGPTQVYLRTYSPRMRLMARSPGRMLAEKKKGQIEDMTPRSSLNRREFVRNTTACGLGILASGAWMLKLAAEIAPASRTSHSVAAEIPTFHLPERPIEEPLPWEKMADAFDQCVMDRKNGVLRARPDGRRYFTSALEAEEDGGLTTFAPLVLGKALRGQDVSPYLPSLGAYFSEKAGIYLDSPNATLCEYWYLMNINAMAAAITRMTMNNDPIAVDRVRRSADRLILLAHRISYNFNEQGYKFDRKIPFTNQDRFRQPDTVGGYAYNMLLAYEMFGSSRYLEEASIGLTHYQSFSRNPWYEIPSGAMACLAAARMSLHDPSIDLQKIIGFALDTQQGPMQLGSWNGRDVNGLMQGFHSEPQDEAYSMESMVALPYLLPMVRYRPELAPLIARYALNVSANVRWFFPEYLPANQQSRPDLTTAVPYERIDKVHAGVSPYASGDYKSHRSIYGGAYILWWDAIVRPTDDKYILQLDASRTDFLSRKTFPTYVYYNPWKGHRSVSLAAPPIFQNKRIEIYDLSQHRMMQKGAHENLKVELEPLSAKALVVLPAGAKEKMEGTVRTFDGIPVDYGPLS